MFETQNLRDETLMSTNRRRLYGSWPLMDQKISHAVMSPSKGIIYLLCGACRIFKIYARLDERPHTKFRHAIVGIEGSERLHDAPVRAIDVVDHVAEKTADRTWHYSRLVIHTSKGQCFILCEDPPMLTSGKARLQIEAHDQYPPNDAVPLEDFQLPLPAQKVNNDRQPKSERARL